MTLQYIGKRFWYAAELCKWNDVWMHARLTDYANSVAKFLQPPSTVMEHKEHTGKHTMLEFKYKYTAQYTC